MSNQLRFLNLTGCVKLGVLYCADNQLFTLDISNCRVLSILYVQNNPFNLQAITDIVNLLPDRNGIEKGWLETSKSEWNESIRPMCEAKNWELHE